MTMRTGGDKIPQNTQAKGTETRAWVIRTFNPLARAAATGTRGNFRPY